MYGPTQYANAKMHASALQITRNSGKNLSLCNLTVDFLLNTALLEWVSEQAVRAYTTPDSVVS